MVTSNNVTCGDITHGDVKSVKNSPSQVSISECNEELRAEATDPIRSVTPSRGNVKRDVKLTSDVNVAETPKGGDFHIVFDHTYSYSPIPSLSVFRTEWRFARVGVGYPVYVTCSRSYFCKWRTGACWF